MFIIHLLFSAVAIMLGSFIVPGVTLTSFWVALVVAIVLGFINTFIKPILFILALPITILSLGLFSLILNALLVMFAAAIVPGFEISGFLAALIFAIVLSIINIVFGILAPRK